MRANLLQPTRARRPATTEHKPDDDSWVDRVADEVTALLREHGLELELVVFYDPIGEMLHGTGFDGSPARYFASLSAPSQASLDRVPDEGATATPISRSSSPG